MTQYEIDVQYSGLGCSLDGVIEQIAGDRVSSGYGVWGTRDMQFRYSTESQAERTRQRLLTEVPTHPAIEVSPPYPVG